MNSSSSLHQKILNLAPWFLICLFLFIVFFSLENKQKISISQNSPIPVDHQLEQFVIQMEKISEKNKTIGKQTPANPKEIKSQYNDVANEYNSLIANINSSEYLQKNRDTKNELIRLSHRLFAEIEGTRSQLENKKRTVASDHLNQQLLTEDYQKFKNNYLYPRFISGLNQESFIFLSATLIFSLSSILSTLLSSHYRKKLINQIDQKNSELKTYMSVMDNMSEGVIVTNRVGVFTYYNQSALDIIGNDVKDVYYQSSLDLIGFHDSEGNRLTKEQLPFHKATRKDLVTDQEIFVKNKKNPQGIYISASNGLFINSNEETLGTVVVMKNMSHKKQLEELWKKEKQIAIEGSQKKSDFLASMSHEIRTPMNGIIGLTTLLCDTNLNSKQSEYVQTIRRSAHSLLALINDILDHSKIEAGKIELLPIHFDLAFLIKDICENFKQVNIEKNNTVDINLDKKLSKFFFADENRIKQIFMNLIGNAIKFTQNGKITIHAQLVKDSNLDSTIRFCVEDTGPGMNQNELERLFQRFFQTKTGVKFGGTGLGLSICKQLVDLMGGQIGVESTPQVGSKFWFELNLKKGDENLAENKISKLSDFEYQFNGKVLLAEDNLINQKVALQFLKNLGFEVDLAPNGLEAVQRFEVEYSKNPNCYQVILMDCNMPVMNGYEATRKINQIQSSSQKPIPVIALTAEGQNTGLQKCLDAGMKDFINKPILVPDLILTLKKYCSYQKQEVLCHIDPLAIDKLKEFSTEEESLISVLFKEYLSSTPVMIKSMNDSLENRNYEELYMTAHTLKSTAATLGVKTLSQLAEEIETLNQPDQIQNLDFELIKQKIKEANIVFENSQKELQSVVDQMTKPTKAAS